jgi:hypothetical protein
MEQNEFTVHLTQTTSSKQLVDGVMREKGETISPVFCAVRCERALSKLDWMEIFLLMKGSSLSVSPAALS